MKINRLKYRDRSLQSCIFRLGLLLLTATISISCNNDKEVDQAVPKGKVLLVYLATDNSLSGEAKQKLAAIVSGADLDPEHRILVYQDQRSRPAFASLNQAVSAVGLVQVYRS